MTIPVGRDWLQSDFHLHRCTPDWWCCSGRGSKQLGAVLRESWNPCNGHCLSPFHPTANSGASKLLNTHTRTRTHTRLMAFFQVSRYQKGKTNLNFTEARDSEWQWHQLGPYASLQPQSMIICKFNVTEELTFWIMPDTVFHSACWI